MGNNGRQRVDFYPTEYYTVVYDLEEYARRKHLSSTTWDRWDGRWWEELTEAERDKWMEEARSELKYLGGLYG